MNEINCKIIQDLLPNYIEQITSNETNESIENHLKGCKDCKKVEEIMKKGIVKEEKKANHQIDYLKKYRNKMNILKIIILLIIIFVLIFLGVKVYQWKFLSNIYKHNVEFEVGNNYKLTVRDGNTGVATQMIYKDGVSFVKIGDEGIIFENDTSKYMIIEDSKQYIELDKNFPPEKLDSKISIGTYSIFNINNESELFKLVLINGIDIHEEEYGERQCYVILYQGEKIWVDKETLFIIRDDYEGQTTEYFLEVNKVTNNDINIPDLNTYTKAE